MDDRDANIDLVFRNGLKDFEVLPPPEVWDGIQPSIKVKRGPIIYVRRAAMIAVVLSLSFLAYRWSREFSNFPDRTADILEIWTSSPVKATKVSTPEFLPVKEKSLSTASQKLFVAGITEIPVLSDSESTSFPKMQSINRTSNLSLNRTFSANRTIMTNLAASDRRSIEVKAVAPQYMPETSLTKGTERWSVGAMASPTYYSSFNSDNSELANQLAASEQSIMSYTGGVALSYKLNKRLSIQTGLYYSSLGQEIGGINSFGGFKPYDYTKGDHNFELLTTSGTIYTNNPDVFLVASGPGDRIFTAYTNDVFDPNKANLQYINSSLIQSFSFLELPVMLRYKIVDKAIDLNLIGGLSYNMMLSNSVYTMVDGGRYPVGTTEGLNLLNVSSSFGMGMEYSFSKKLSLNVEPTFRYYLNPFNEFMGFTAHPYSFGVFSGISYKF